MKTLFRCYLLVISLSVYVCVNLTAEEESESQNSIEDLYEIGIEHWDGGARKNEDGEWESASGWDIFRQRIETSKELITDIAKLPKKFTRPESKQNIFRKGEWALVASPNWESVNSTDGQLTFDISEQKIYFILSNWKPTAEIRLSYRLAIDDALELQTKYRTIGTGFVPHYTWQNVSDEFIEALEEGKTLKVSLIDKDKEDIHIEEYSLSGFSENMVAVRKLLKDSPRPDNNE